MPKGVKSPHVKTKLDLKSLLNSLCITVLLYCCIAVLLYC